MHTLIVSPHLDDAALSCAGRLAAWRAVGRRATVATLFSAGSPAHRRRRKEDRTALGSLGVEVRHLGLADAPWRVRRARPLTLDALMLSGPPEGADVEAAREALATLLREGAFDRALFPLGVGGHVDHLVAFACHDLVPSPLFYEDRPYAFVPALRTRRLHALEGGAARVTHAEREVQESLADAPFSDASLLGRAPEIAAALARLEPPRASLRVVEEGDFSAFANEVVGAIAAYRSQLRALFGDASVEDTWSARGAFVERLWTYGASETSRIASAQSPGTSS